MGGNGTAGTSEDSRETILLSRWPAFVEDDSASLGFVAPQGGCKLVAVTSLAEEFDRGSVDERPSCTTVVSTLFEGGGAGNSVMTAESPAELHDDGAVSTWNSAPTGRSVGSHS